MTAEQLQRKLREEKKALVYVFPIDDWKSFGYNLLLLGITSPFYEASNNCQGFPTWDLALEAGVREALNHIS